MYSDYYWANYYYCVLYTISLYATQFNVFKLVHIHHTYNIFRFIYVYFFILYVCVYYGGVFYIFDDVGSFTLLHILVRSLLLPNCFLYFDREFIIWEFTLPTETRENSLPLECRTRMEWPSFKGQPLLGPLLFFILSYTRRLMPSIACSFFFFFSASAQSILLFDERGSITYDLKAKVKAVSLKPRVLLGGCISVWCRVCIDFSLGSDLFPFDLTLAFALNGALCYIKEDLFLYNA